MGPRHRLSIVLLWLASIVLSGPAAPLAAQPSPPVRAQADMNVTESRAAPTDQGTYVGGLGQATGDTVYRGERLERISEGPPLPSGLEVFRQNVRAEVRLNGARQVTGGSFSYERDVIVPPSFTCAVDFEQHTYPGASGGWFAPTHLIGYATFGPGNTGLVTQTWRGCNPNGSSFSTSLLNVLLTFFDNGDLALCLPPTPQGTQDQIRQACLVNPTITLQGPPAVLEATGIEVTQAIQDLGTISDTGLNRIQQKGSVPLVAGKPTVVRFHVKGSRAQPILAGATLTGRRGGTVLGALEPVRTPLEVRKEPFRGYLNDSFFFLLPRDWTQAGDLSLTATISAAVVDPGIDFDSLQTTVTFETAPPLLVRVVYYDYVLAGPPVQQVVADRTVGPSLYDDLRRMFPTAAIVVTQWEINNPKPVPQTPAAGRQLLNAMVLGREEDPTIWIGVLGTPLLGSLPRFEGAGPVKVANTSAAALAAVAAALGGDDLDDRRCTLGGPRLDDGEPYPYPRGLIGGPDPAAPQAFYGFDVLLARVVSSYRYDLITLCDPIWISNFTTSRIREGLDRPLPLTRASGQMRSRATMSTVLSVRGGVSQDGLQASIDVFERRVGTPTAAPGPYRLRAFDVAGALLQETPFALSPGLDASFLAFSVEAPDVPGTRRVAVYSDALGRELASAPISVHPPTVSVTNRTGGPSLPASGPVTLTWSAADPDNDPLSYRIDYSRDNRSTWRPLGYSVTTSFTVDAGQLDGTNGAPTGWLRVVAHDGALTGAADSGPFSVAGKGPTATISSPRIGSFAAPGQLVHLMGTAQDLEDGSLADSQLQWRSSRDGVLGTGSFLSLTSLTTGVHALTLKATDSHGLIGETSITLTVTATPPTPVPALDVAPDIIAFTYAQGGSNPSPQPLAVRNPGSGTVTWTAQSSAPWLTLSSPGGSGEADVQVGINVTALPVGTVSHQGQIAVAAPGVSSAPKLVSVQANANPTASPTRTITPLVSPTPTASRTPVPTATRTPTATPAPVAGRSFTLEAGAQPVLTWQGGTETGVLVIRWDAIANAFAFLPPPANPLGFLVNTYTDPGPLPGQTYCYVLLVLGSNPPSISDVRGLSDLHCIYPQTATGVPLTGFKVRLDQGPIVYLNWNAVPNATNYELTAVRFDSTPVRVISLQGASTSFVEEHGGLSTCYRLVAKNGASELGGTQQLCAAPGVSSLTPNGVTRLSLRSALDQVGSQALAGRPGR